MLVVDLQNDFCDPTGAMAALGHDVSANVDVVGRVAPFLTEVRRHGVPVVHLQQHASDATASPARRARAAKMGRTASSVCAAGTWGAEPHPLVPVADVDMVVHKFRYSGFVATNLDLVLRGAGVETVIVVGTAANVCVDSTARDAFMRDYHVFVARDLVGHTRADLAASALDNLAIYFAEVTTSDRLLARLADSDGR